MRVLSVGAALIEYLARPYAFPGRDEREEEEEEEEEEEGGGQRERSMRRRKRRMGSSSPMVKRSKDGVAFYATR